MNLPDQWTLGQAGNASGREDIEGIGGGGDNGVGTEIEPRSMFGQLPQESEYVDNATDTVPGVVRRAAPDLVDAIERFPSVGAAGRGLHTAEVGLGSGHDRYAMPEPHPLPGKIVGAVFHSEPRPARVVIDIEDIQAQWPLPVL